MRRFSYIMSKKLGGATPKVYCIFDILKLPLEISLIWKIVFKRIGKEFARLLLIQNQNFRLILMFEFKSKNMQKRKGMNHMGVQ